MKIKFMLIGKNQTALSPKNQEVIFNYDATTKCYRESSYGSCTYFYNSRYFNSLSSHAGKEVLWQAGTDHAGIATQMVVERKLSEEGFDRRTLGRENLLKKYGNGKRSLEVV